jgi:D-lactate dehydrogenase (cytochrome)
MKFLDQEHGDALNLMKLLKRSIDPQNIMNPGKVLTL